LQTEDCSNGDQIYDLVSFVVHCGVGLNRGHYISVVKSHGYWFLFDDEQVEVDLNFEIGFKLHPMQKYQPISDRDIDTIFRKLSSRENF